MLLAWPEWTPAQLASQDPESRVRVQQGRCSPLRSWWVGVAAGWWRQKAEQKRRVQEERRLLIRIGALNLSLDGGWGLVFPFLMSMHRHSLRSMRGCMSQLPVY